jgi:hypothetical protein
MREGGTNNIPKLLDDGEQLSLMQDVLLGQLLSYLLNIYLIVLGIYLLFQYNLPLYFSFRINHA